MNLEVKMLKKLLLTALAAVVAVSTAAQADGLKVGFSNRTLNGPYFAALSTHIENKGKAEGWEMILTDARADFTKQLGDCEDLLSKNLDYLILNPQDPVASLRCVQSANDKNVPVIIIDSDIGLEAKVVTRIAPDNVGNNLLIGQYAAEQAGGDEIKLAIISGNQGNLVGRARRSNFILGIIDAQLRSMNATNLDIVTQVWGGWDQQGGLKAMEDVLVAKPEINAVYTENDDMALGAVRALAAAGRKDVQIYSYDGNKYAYDAIAKGMMAATGENNPEKMAQSAIDIISELKVTPNKDFPDYTLMPTLMVNKKNAKEVYNKDSLF